MAVTVFSLLNLVLCTVRSRGVKHISVWLNRIGALVFSFMRILSENRFTVFRMRSMIRELLEGKANAIA